MIFCIDFDGTVVENDFPRIGTPLPGAFETLRELKAAGHHLVLWTCREDEGFNINKRFLTDAIEFCKEHGIEFDGINETPKEKEFRPEDSPKRKAFAHVYIDDRNFGGFPGWESVRKVYLYKHDASVEVYPTGQRENKLLHDRLNCGETRKAHARRKKEGWFEKYAPADKPGLDIGSQFDPLNKTFRRWDYLFGDGDATDLTDVPNETYHTVYASHILEHIDKPMRALQNWFRVLKPGGHMIVVVPHRDLYEKRKTLPSQWNPEHRWFWMPDDSELPCTICLKDLIESIPNAELVEYRVLDEGYDHSLPVNHHPVGEFSIEAVVRKLT